MNSIDLYIQDYLLSSRTEQFNDFFYIVTSFFDVSLLFFMITMVVIYIVHKIKGRKDSIFFLLNIFITMLLVYVLKNVFNTSRPVEGLVYAFGGSFPSYHATMSTVFFISLYRVFRENIKVFYRKLLYIFCILAILLVSFSRLYLGVHWFTDVVFGIFLGIFVCHISINIHKRYFDSL